MMSRRLAKEDLRGARRASVATRTTTTPAAEGPVVRVVVDGEPTSSPAAASAMLIEAFGTKWPGPKAGFTITPGGFLAGRFPERWTGGISWASQSADLATLVELARPVVEAAITPKVRQLAKRRTDLLTLGVDLLGDSGSAELVAVFDPARGRVVRWTGKSYPVAFQGKTLVQVVDLSTHLMKVAGERVLVLGCHDLTMFSARSWANQAPDGVRRGRCAAMHRLVSRFRPTLVLQHPHSTDSPAIWREAWAGITRRYPSIEVWASGVAYFNRAGDVRQPLHAVLDATRSQTGVRDVIVTGR